MNIRGNDQHERGSESAGMPFGHVDEWGEVAVDYLDGRLSIEVKARVEAHLRDCPDCRTRVHHQQVVVTFLRETELDEAPADMEDLVLGELLFPSQAVARPFGKPLEEPRRRTLWPRKIRPWLPATVAVAALLIAIVAFGLVRGSTNNASVAGRDATTAAAADTVAESTPGESTFSATTTALAGISTTAGATSTAPSTTAPPPTTVLDKNAMVKALNDAGAPAYIAFYATALDEASKTSTTRTAAGGTGSSVATTETAAVTIPSAKVDDTVAQITAFTGMDPLDESLWLDGPTFAAFVSREDVEPLVDLLRSMGSSVSLTVSLSWEPPATKADVAALLLEHQREFPSLLAEIIPSPAVSRWNFVTSTTSPAGGQGDDDGTLAPAVADAHILVVLFVRR